MSNERTRPLSRTVTERNVQVKPATKIPISSYAPPKPVSPTVKSEANNKTRK